MRLLIVEDEQKIANALKRGLRQQKYAVDVAYNGDDGWAMASTEPYDLIILDRMLPGQLDGMGILRRLRAEQNTTPILLLTAKAKVIDRTEGLNSGADDYLVKPFAFIELLARVRALLRRPTAAISTELSYHDVVLQPEGFTATRAGKLIALSPREFSLLEYLMRNAERLITKEQLIQHVWDYDADILPNTIEVYIGYLRNKIDKAFADKPRLIHTKRGYGYVFGVEA